MRLRNKVVIGIVVASLAVAGLVAVAMARGSAGMMSRVGGRMMGGSATCPMVSTGTCTMTQAQCAAAGNASGTCPMARSGSGARAATGTCPMSGAGSSATCPMARAGAGA